MLIRLVLGALSLSLAVEAADVSFHLSDFGASALNKKNFRLTSLSTPRVAGGRIIGSDTKTISVDASGDVTTNLVYGNYRVDFSGSGPLAPTTSFTILVPDSDDAVDAGDLIVPTPTAPSASVGYNQTAADARFVRKTNSWSTGQTLTNATFAGSTNAFTFVGGTAGDFLTTDGTNIFPATVTPGEGLTAAITSINSDTNAAQAIVTDESGTNFAVATTSGETTLSLPIASASNTGKLSPTDWITFNAKQAALGYTPISNSSGTGTNTTLAHPTLSGPSFSGSVTNTGVAASKILRTDANNVESAVIIGSGLTFDGTNLVSTGSGGSVTSVAVTADSDFEITGSPITTSGTINIANTNSTGSGKYVRQTSPTLTTPTIASFVNANHNHQDSAGGGALAEAAVTGLTADLLAKQPASDNLTNWSALATTTKVSTNGTGFPALTGDVTTVQGAVATTIAANAVTDSKFRQGVARSVVGIAGNATANTADIQGTTDQVLRVTGAGTGLGFGAIDLSKSAAAGGVLQAGSFPALTGDITTSAGALATTLKSTGTAGTYRSITFDAQGRETSGTNPTTFSGYGLSDTSANLAAALTDETGTGAAVFGTAPTITAGTFSGPTTTGNWTNSAITIGTFTNTGAMGISGATTFGSTLSVAGNETFATDNIYDLGASGATRPRTGYFGTSLIVSGTSQLTGTQLQFFNNSGSITLNGLLIANEASTSILQIGTDATAQNTPTAITIKGPDGLAGTGTNINGANLTIAGGRNTGTGTGGSLLFQTAPAGSTGTAAGTLTTRLTIDSTGLSTFAGQVSASSGFGSTDTTAAVNIAATGWTNTFGKNATVYFDGTAMTFTVFNNALTSIYTNAVATTGTATVFLQPSGKVTISGTSVTGRATPQ